MDRQIKQKPDIHVKFSGVSKSYDGETFVVKNMDAEIERGEFLTLLGPSGSGKTTCLMMLAGFQMPTFGEIQIDGKPVHDIPPYRRGIGMVFQNYALFPHMSVGRNLAFPLQVRNISNDQQSVRIKQALELVRLKGFDNRVPRELSGGQQQRVAIARALVFEPELVLMDEPLGALDRALRDEMQYELRRIHRELGVTMVYVTHDQQEAMVLSDRVAVFEEGRIQQVGTPEVLYEEPVVSFVSGFIGENNHLLGLVRDVQDGMCTILIGDTEVRSYTVDELRPGSAVTVSIRPERICLSPSPGVYTNECNAKVVDIMFLGDHLRLNLNIAGRENFILKIPNIAGHGAVLRGDTVKIGWAAQDSRAFNLE